MTGLASLADLDGWIRGAARLSYTLLTTSTPAAPYHHTDRSACGSSSRRGRTASSGAASPSRAGACVRSRVVVYIYVHASTRFGRPGPPRGTPIMSRLHFVCTSHLYIYTHTDPSIYSLTPPTPPPPTASCSSPRRGSSRWGTRTTSPRASSSAPASTRAPGGATRAWASGVWGGCLCMHIHTSRIAPHTYPDDVVTPPTNPPPPHTHTHTTPPKQDGAHPAPEPQGRRDPAAPPPAGRHGGSRQAGGPGQPLPPRARGACVGVLSALHTDPSILMKFTALPPSTSRCV